MSQHDLGAMRHRFAGAVQSEIPDLDGEKPAAIYDMVLKASKNTDAQSGAVKAGANQTLAAEMLGINRKTLRENTSCCDWIGCSTVSC